MQTVRLNKAGLTKPVEGEKERGKEVDRSNTGLPNQEAAVSYQVI